MRIFNKSGLPKVEREKIKYLDGISGGLISAIKPDKLKVVDELINGENFQLGYSPNKDGSASATFFGNYNSPIGNILLNFGTLTRLPKDLFEEEFLKKGQIDSFLTRLNKKNGGLLEEMLKDRVSDPTFGRYPAYFAMQLFDNGRHCSMNIESNKGLFFYNEQNLNGSGEFKWFEEEINVDNKKITFEDLLGAKISYGKISPEEVQEIAKVELEKVSDDSRFKYHPKDMKIINAKFGKNLERLSKSDFFGNFLFEKNEFDGKNNFSYEIPGDHSGWNEQIKAWGVYPYLHENKTKLIGNPLLIVSLGREIASGKYNLLKPEK
jgi:hypothetical protein